MLKMRKAGFGLLFCFGNVHIPPPAIKIAGIIPESQTTKNPGSLRGFFCLDSQED